jgi:hypothetical protein
MYLNGKVHVEYPQGNVSPLIGADRLIKKRRIATKNRQKNPQPCEDASEVVSDGREDGVGGFPGATFEIAAAEVALGLEVTDYGLDRGAASQLGLDGAEETALLSGDKDAARVLGIMPAIPFVSSAGSRSEFQSILDGLAQGVTVIGIAGRSLGVQQELAARGAGVGDDDLDLDAELVRRAGLAFY